MAIAYVQGQNASVASGTSKTTAAFGLQPIGGNAIIVGVVIDNATVSNVTSVTDAGGNTYAKAISTVNTVNLDIWYAVDIISAASHTVTVNWTSSTDAHIVVQEFSGIAKEVPLDATGGASSFGSGTALTTTAITSAWAGDVLIILGTSNGSAAVFTVGGSFSNIDNSTGASFWSLGMESQVLGAPGVAPTGAMTSSVNTTWRTTSATFKSAANHRGESGNIGQYVSSGDGMSRSEIAN